MTNRHDSDWSPLEPEDHERQLAALRALVRSIGARAAIDLGCGSGRVALPMSREGVSVLGIDRDEEALQLCARDGLTVRCADFLDPGFDCSIDGAPPDCVWCLGNTFMEINDGAQAVGLLARLRAAMRPGSCLILDNIPARHWPLVADGCWVTGVSPDGAEQIVWAPDDNAFALRRGAEVDPFSEEVRDNDRVVRLWTRNELRLLAIASGWDGPHADETGEFLVFRRPEG